MDHLADTHALLWSVSDPARLGPATRRIFADAPETVLFSMASVWEIAIKVGLGKLRLDTSVEDFVDDQLRSGLRLLPISVAHAARVADLPRHHRDPFDRMLVAQSLVDRLTLLSRDPALPQYLAPMLW